MNKNLTHIMTDLFSKPVDSKELASKMQRLGFEIRKIVQDDETTVGKLRGLLASFETIIPDERQRYQAALQALCTTSRLSRQQIQKAMSAQLEELKALEKESMPAKSAWRDATKSLAARSEQLKDEIARVRDQLARLEGEEQSLQASMATQEKDLAGVEKTVKELFANMAAEIGTLCRKVSELTVEAPTAETAAKPAPAAAKHSFEKPPAEKPVAEKGAVAKPAAEKPPPKEPAKSEAPRAMQEEDGDGDGDEDEVTLHPPSPPDTKFQKRCPMCGGQFNLLEYEKTWQCYVCAYEEPSEG